MARYDALDQAIRADGAACNWRALSEQFHVSKATFFRRAKAVGIVWPRKYPDDYYDVGRGERRNRIRSERYWKDGEYRASVIAKSTQWAVENRQKSMLRAARSRAKSMGLPFNLTIEDIVIPERCPVLGLVLKHATGVGGGGHASPSIDRIIPELGYVKGNVRIISRRANVLRNDATVEELEAIARDLKVLLASRKEPAA